jgi:dinuclear metal center YbgI/SA1388 family protein
MTVKEFYEALCEYVPTSLSCEWDHDGLLVCPDATRQVRRVLCTLDVTEEAVSYAEINGFDLILSHHPLIFKPLFALTEENHVARKAMRLLQSGISVISLHTRADAVSDGVNDRLCEQLGLYDVTVLDVEGESIARVGKLDGPMPFADFAMLVKDVLGAPAVLTADADRPVHRVALCGGDGKDFVRAAIAAGADTYVSGRIGYHEMTDAAEMGINMIEAGHYYTETHITDFFCDLVHEFLPDAKVERFASNMIILM